VDVSKYLIVVVVAAIAAKHNEIREQSGKPCLRTDAARRNAVVDRRRPVMLARYRRWQNGF